MNIRETIQPNDFEGSLWAIDRATIVNAHNTKIVSSRFIRFFILVFTDFEVVVKLWIAQAERIYVVKVLVLKAT